MSKITQTSQAIIDLQNFKDEVAETMEKQERNKLQFFLGDLKVENCKLKLDENELSTDATKRILGSLRVKNNFLELQKKMTETDWETVSEKLRSIYATQPVYARKLSDKPTIVDLQIANRKAQNGGIQVNEIFDMLTQAMVESVEDTYVLKGASYSEEKESVDLTLMQDGKSLDVFGTGDDIWKTGKKLAWSGDDFSVYPFFERLVCTNGNVGRQYGFATNVSKSKYNFNKIKSVLDKEILNANDIAASMLSGATKHLKGNSVSVKEFLQYRGMFNEENHEDILKKYFDLSYLNKAYKCDVEGMHAIWKSTADTGKNAYDFFNDLTYIASHPKEVKLEEDLRRSLQIKASDLLFKENLDLELLAPKITSWKK